MHAAFPRSAFASVRVCTPSSIRPAALLASSTPLHLLVAGAGVTLHYFHCTRAVSVFHVLRVSRREQVRMDSTVVSLLCFAGRRAHGAGRARCLQPFWRSYLEPRVHKDDSPRARGVQQHSPQAARRGLASCAVQYVDVVLRYYAGRTARAHALTHHCTAPLHCTE